MAHIATNSTNPFAFVQRAGAALGGAILAVGNFFTLVARVNEAQQLLTQSEEELAARGLTRQQVVDFVIEGDTAR